MLAWRYDKITCSVAYNCLSAPSNNSRACVRGACVYACSCQEEINEVAKDKHVRTAAYSTPEVNAERGNDVMVMGGRGRKSRKHRRKHRRQWQQK